LLLKTREITGEEADAILFGESKASTAGGHHSLVCDRQKSAGYLLLFLKGCVVKAVDLDVEFFLLNQSD